MHAHTRALIAACAYAVIAGKKVAGIYDYTESRHLRIAAEARENRLQAADGERAVMFGGPLPDLYDEGDKTFVSLEIDGSKARGYDRGSAGHYEAEVTDRLVQMFDHNDNTWFAFAVQVVEDDPGTNC